MPIDPNSFSPAQRLSRIRIYVWQAALVSLVGGIVHLSALSDEQLAHMSIMRWVLTLLVLVLSPVIEGINALRAAIDRSTSSGPHSDEETPAPQPTATATTPATNP